MNAQRARRTTIPPRLQSGASPLDASSPAAASRRFTERNRLAAAAQCGRQPKLWLDHVHVVKINQLWELIVASASGISFIFDRTLELEVKRFHILCSKKVTKNYNSSTSRNVQVLKLYFMEDV